MAIDPLKDFPGYALRRASLATMTELTERLVPLGLRPTEASVLVVIGTNPGVTQSEVGQVLDVARANMAPLAARLLQRGLISREKVDGRSHGLSLTTSGRQIQKKALEIMSDMEASILRRIPQAHHAVFVAALQALWTSEEAYTEHEKGEVGKPAKRPAPKCG